MVTCHSWAQPAHGRVLITTRNSSCGKVMFSQACVKNFVHGWMHGKGACMPCTPCHTCPLSCMPPATHTPSPLPCTPPCHAHTPAMHTPLPHTHTLPHMPPSCNACPTCHGWPHHAWPHHAHPCSMHALPAMQAPHHHTCPPATYTPTLLPCGQWVFATHPTWMHMYVWFTTVADHGPSPRADCVKLEWYSYYTWQDKIELTWNWDYRTLLWIVPKASVLKLGQVGCCYLMFTTYRCL